MAAPLDTPGVHAMRFYVLEDSFGQAIGAEMTLAAAKREAAAYGMRPGAYSVTMYDMPVNSETVRRLIGQLGGFATEIRRVIESEA